MNIDRAIKWQERNLLVLRDVYEDWENLQMYVGAEEMGLTPNELNTSVLQSIEDYEVSLFVLNVLKDKKEREENKPLTLEQLKEMVGKPVYLKLETTNKRTGYKIISSINDYSIMFTDDSWLCFENVPSAKFYKHKPVEVEHVTK